MISDLANSISMDIIKSIISTDSTTKHFFYSEETQLLASNTDSASLVDVDFYDGVSGYMYMRYKAPASFVNYGYLMVCNDGGSSNAIGMRTDSGDNLRGFVKAGGSNIHSAANGDEKIVATTQVDMIKFTPTSASIISGGYINTQSFAALPTGLDVINFSARNANADAKDLLVYEAAIDKGDHSFSSINSSAYRGTDYLIAAAGQSLAVGHFNSQASGSNGGDIETRTTVGVSIGENTCCFVNGATGGSSISNITGDSQYWYDVAGDARGNAFDTFTTAVNATGYKPNFIMWSQGEADSDNIGSEITRAQYKEYLLWVFSEFRNLYGGVEIVIQCIGRRTAGYSNTGGIQTVREIQQELATEYNWIHLGAETYDLALYTGDGQNVHLADAGYVIAAERNGNKFLALRGYSVSGSVNGMEITGATRASTVITVTVAHDAGTDFTPTTGIEGFTFFDDSTEIAINAAVRTNATTITLTLNSAPTGVETLYYGYDDMASLTVANVVVDNSATALPLKPKLVRLN